MSPGLRFFIALIGIGVFIGISIFIGIQIEEHCSRAEITDIIQVSPKGFSSPATCILMTDQGKRSFHGSDCFKQIGEEICIY